MENVDTIQMSVIERNNLNTIDEGLELACTDPQFQSVHKSPPHDSENESIDELKDRKKFN